MFSYVISRETKNQTLTRKYIFWTLKYNKPLENVRDIVLYESLIARLIL